MVEKKINIARNSFIILISLFVLLSCDINTNPEETEAPGIPEYKLEMEPDEYGEFVSNEFASYAANAIISFGDKSYKVKIKHHGFSSRGRYKKNYSLEFDVGDPILKTGKVILSGQATDPSMLRSYLAREIFSEIGLPAFDIAPVFVTINNEELGLYFLYENIDEQFFAKRGMDVGELFKAVNGNAQFSFENNKELRYGFEKKIPEDDNYSALERVVKLIDSESASTFKENVEKVFDIENYLRYSAASELMLNWDGLVHNFFVFSNGATGRFELIPWDLDYTFSPNYSLSSSSGTNDLLKKLLTIPEYRNKYRNFLYEFIEGCFSQESLKMKIEKMKPVIKKAYYSDRWIAARGYNIDNEAEAIMNFVSERCRNILEQLGNY